MKTLNIIFFVLLLLSLIDSQAQCNHSSPIRIKALIKAYEIQNKDPNMENSTIRIDRKVIPKEFILKLKGKG